MKKKTIAIFGLGLFGSTIAKTISTYEYDVIAVDINSDNIDAIEPYVTQAVIGDFTDIDLLREIGLEDCNLAIIAASENLESSVLGIMNCHKLGIEDIIIKAKNTTHMEVFKQLGVTRIIQPEKEAGAYIARNIMAHHIQDVIQLDNANTSIIEFKAPDQWIGKSIIELNLRKNFSLNVIGIREKKAEALIVDFDPHYILKEGSSMVAVAINDVFEQHDYLELL